MNNEYYSMLLKNLGEDKDSPVEPCQVLEFDANTLQAKVLGLRSKKTKENVIVVFPSFYLGTGIISFPVPNSNGLVFVGAENTNYLLPAQYFLPTKRSVNNVAISDASPGQFDFLLKLNNLEPGEILLRSLNHAQIFLSNSGEIELLTKKLNRISLLDIDDSFEMVVQRARQYMGYSKWYKGAHETKGTEELNEYHEYKEIFEETPNWNEDEVSLHDAVRLNVEDISMKEELQTPIKNGPKFIEQFINVYEKDTDGEYSERKIKSMVDDCDLVHLKQLFGSAPGEVIKNQRLRYMFTQSKEGAISICHEKEEEDKGYRFILNNDVINGILDSTSNTLSMNATADGFRLDVAQNGSPKRSFLEVRPDFAKIAHVTSAGKEMALTIDANTISDNAQTVSMRYGSSIMNFGEDELTLECGDNVICTNEEQVTVFQRDGSKIEFKDGDIICNGTSFNSMRTLLNKLAEINGLEDRL